jgi:hypothetical protein
MARGRESLSALLHLLRRPQNKRMPRVNNIALDFTRVCTTQWPLYILHQQLYLAKRVRVTSVNGVLQLYPGVRVRRP